MQSKRKSSWKILVVAAAANLLAVAAQAVPDAPHDAGNSIGCLTCHQMTSTYPKLLPPLGGTPLDMDDTYANRVCRSCHDGSGSTIVLTDTHSSLTMSNKYGDWTVECWVCHNEHLQEQNRYNGSTYGMYIRRNINLANIKKPDGTSLKTGTKSVVFTGPATFADGNAIYNGICEVCHTQTTHFRNDGSGSNQNHDGKQGSDCVSCHNHDTGFTGGAVHNTFITDDNKTGDPAVLCSGCHSNYATAPETAHSACAACHTTAPTLLDSAFPTADGQVDDDGTSMFANLAAAGYTFNGTTGRLNDPDGTDIAGVGGNGVFALVKCGVCHAAKPDALAAVPAEHGGHPVTDWDYSTITNDCLDCHADGGLGTIQGVHSNTCTLCHVNPGAGDFARKIGDAANGVDGNALLASGRTGDCLTCHPGATYTKTKIHHDTANAVATPSNGCTTACHNTTTGHAGNHNTLVAIQNPPCQGCHNAAAASGGNNVPVDGTAGNLIHDYCTSCHSNPSNDLIATVTAPTAHATTMNNADGTTATNNGGGTCTACHTAYFDGHEHKTAHTMPTVAFCLNCHTATSVPYSDAGDVHAGSGCMTCHDAANGTLKGSAVAATGGENCQGCHSGYFASHDHADTSTGTQSHSLQSVALCEGCHTPYAAGAAVSATIHDADGCFTCHNSGTGALQGSAASAAGTEDCQGCHTTYFDGHGHGGTTATPNHTETLSKDALCGNCHGSSLSGPDAVTAPYASGSEAHFLDGCFTCHSPVNGSPIGSAANWGATWSARAIGTCATCHTDAFSGHSHSHTFTATADCATCHGNPSPVTSNARDAVAAPFVGPGEVHATLGCATCHNAATGALIGSATGKQAATGCIDCHSGWTALHDGATGVDHTGRVGVYTACYNCHVESATSSNARVAITTPYVGATEVHATNRCATCHTGADNGGLKTGPFAKADLIVASGICSDCHIATTTWKVRHTGANGLDHTTRVDGLAGCIVCHDATAGGPNGSMPVNAATPAGNKVHDDCYSCHNSTFGPNLGLLQPIIARGGSANIASGNCGTCHSAAYFDSHVHGTTGGYVEHDVTYVAGTDISQVSNPQSCGDCHNGNNADGNGVALNSWADILSEHVSGCARCHSYTDDGNGTPPQATNDTTIASGTGVTCTTCHTPKLVPAASSDHGYLPHDDAPNRTVVSWTGASGAGADPDCKVCHDDANTEVVYSTTTHSGTCATCHVGIPNPVQGTTTLALAMPDGGAGTNNGGGSCVVCHTASYDVHTVNNANQAATLHNNVSLTYAATNGCDACHGGAGSLDTWVEIVSLHTNCATCHSSDVADVVATIQTGRGVANGFTGGNTAVDCDDCHITDTDVGPNFNVDDAVTLRGHGQTAATVRGEHNMFSTSGIVGVTDCVNCHDMGTTDVVANFQKRIELHTSPVSGAANSCLTCHAGQGDPANAQIAAGIAGTAINCNDCHTAKGVYTLHGLTEATVADVHDKFNDSSSTAEKYCGNCHITATAANRLDLHVNCLYCHDPGNTAYVSPTPTTSGTPAPTVVLNGRSTGGNTVQTCENCHAAKGNYSMHGLTDDNGADGVVDVHDNFNSVTGQAVTYTGKLAGAYGGLKVTSYSCGDCHAPDPNTKTFSDLNVIQLHTRTNGSGIGDCLTCHNNNDHNSTTSWMAVIKVARSTGSHLGGGGTATVECEDCHQAAYDADTASGEKMYQYDGVRHHKTANAQAGKCTFCHADPRPSVASIYAATADSVGTYQTGWFADNGLAYPVGNLASDADIPTQPACRLCHTNYGTDGAGTPYTVNVQASQNNDTDSTDATDLHRYPTLAVNAPTNGLAVYANDYDATGTAATISVPNTSNALNLYAKQITQSQIHRIQANDSTSMIKVENYGACLGCHSVQKMHAAPRASVDYTDPESTTCTQFGDPHDMLRYAPGRSLFNLWRSSGATQDVWSYHRKPQDWAQNPPMNCGSGNLFNRGKNFLKSAGQTTWNYGTIAGTTLTRVPGDTGFDNFESLAGMHTTGGSNVTYDQIVRFAAITAPTLDDITITKAEYTGSAIVVHATSSIGSGQTFSFTYTGGGCGTTAMSWVVDHYEGTCNTPTGFTAGTDTVTAANTTTTSTLDTRTRLVDLAPAAAIAADDGLSSAATGGPYALDVLANDTGTGLQVASVSAVSKFSGAGTCGTITNDGASVGYTPGGGNAVCTFTYQAQAYSGGSPYGAPSQATVTVTQSVNVAPTAVNDSGYSVAESSGITQLTGMLANDSDGGDGGALSIATVGNLNCGAGTGQAVAINGDNVSVDFTAPNAITTCTFDYTISDTFGTSNTATVTVDVVAACGAVAKLQDWSVVINGTNAGPHTASYTISAGSESSRLLVVSVGSYTAGNNAPAHTVTYGGQTLTQVHDANAALGATGRAGHWIGYCDEACIDAAETAGNTTLSVTASGVANVQIRAMLLDNVQQAAPVPASGVGDILCNTYDATACTESPGHTYAIGDQVAVATGGYTAVTYTISGNDNAMTNVTGANYGVAFSQNAASPGTATDAVTLTPSTNGREMGAAVVFQSTCNNN